MSRRHPRGVTLVELVLMISIIGILAFLAAPRGTAVHEVKLRAAARRVAADLRYAQSLAVHRRTRHALVFDPGADRYTVVAVRDATVRPSRGTPVADPADPARPLGIDFRRSSAFNGVHIDSAAFGRAAEVTFDAFGVPRDAWGRELEQPARVVLSYEDASAAIAVAPRTGKVTLR